MNKLAFDIYEEACEPFLLRYDESLIAEFEFYPPKDGYLLIGERTYKVTAGKCNANLKTLDDGAYAPHFYTDKLMYSLPTLNKDGRIIRFEPPHEDFIYKIALRARFLARRILALESKVSELTEKIEGSRLSIGDQTE